jgi:NAD(P)-dependent dehydrogenase (short-subunit alcohol dehydrogenase family)
MQIAGSVALVTGANRGIGRALAAELVERGAAKVYATARDTAKVDLPGVEVLPLDITDPEQVAAAAEIARDVTLLVNNAGISSGLSLLNSPEADIRREMEVNLFGTLNVTRAFAPTLVRNGGGAMLNVLSALSWYAFPGSGAYAMSKAAEWGMSNALRLELFEQGTQVTGVFLAMADTEMMADFKHLGLMPPSQVAQLALDGLEAGSMEVVVDPITAHVKASLAKDPAELYTPEFATKGQFNM